MKKLFFLQRTAVFRVCSFKTFRIMKLTSFLLLMTVFNAFGSITYSQSTKLNLDLKDVSIQSILNKIEEQSEFFFLYSSKMIDVTKKMDIQVENELVTDVLDEILAKTDIKYSIKDRQILLINSEAEAAIEMQEKQLSGKITGSENEPLPGVNIVVKGSTIGTLSDINGNFILSVPPDAKTLTFSFIGMNTLEVEIGNQTVFNIEMEESAVGLDEVVVVGYGTRLREELTGSVSTMPNEKLKLSTSPSVLGRIKGQVSGVTITSANTPGGSSTIRVRGLGTINDNEPLYIIDGVPSDPSNRLNPNDIESISILKDASSAAIYGTRGSNGVIIITTKRGKKGQAPRFDFTARTGLSQGVNRYDLLNVEEFGEMLWLEAKNKGSTPGVDWSHPQYGSGTQPRIPDYIMPVGAMEGDLGTNPELYRFPSYAIIKANKEGTDWYDEIYRNAINMEYDLSASGGGENVNYAFSGSYLKEDGFLIHTGFERFTFRSNTDAKFANWLRAGQSMQASYTSANGDLTNNYDEAPISRAFQAQAIIPVYDIMGNYAGSRAIGMGASQNAVAMLTRGKNNFNKNIALLGNFFGEADIIKGLTFKSLLGYNYTQGNTKNMRLANPEAAMAETIDRLTVGSSNTLQWNWANTLNYSTTIANVHKINVILGTEAIESAYQTMTGGRTQYFSTDPNYMQLDSGEANQSNSGSGSEWSLFSAFGRINYDFLGKYYFEATVRRDGSSRFGLDKRYATFPAASFAWAISQENFMTGTKTWLDLLKLRLGWGVAGNDRIGNYNVFTTFAANQSWAAYALDGSNTRTVVGFQPSAYGNTNVTWETTRTLNFGLDLKAFKDAFSFSADVWTRNTTDMLYRLSIPMVMGVATAPFVNIGEMQNKGFDLELGYNNTALGGKFRYGFSATISRYVNEIKKLSNNANEKIITGSFRGMNYSRAEIGTSFPEFYGYIVDGIFQSDEEAAAHPTAFGTGGVYNKAGHFKYRDVTPDGVINTGDMTYIGSPHPDFTGGLNIDLGYGNIDMNMFFAGSYGNYMINLVRRWMDFGLLGCNLSHDALYETWGSPYLKSNTDATLPIFDRLDGSQQPSTHWIEDASYLRLKTLRLSYTFPDNVLNRIGMQSLNIYGQMTNLFTITKYSGLDPELDVSGTSAGCDQGAWPTPRQIMLGITLGF